MGYSPDVLSYGFGGIVLLGGVIGYMKVGEYYKTWLSYNNFITC